jgi:sRNA-binding carbon storage regulator CsrA
VDAPRSVSVHRDEVYNRIIQGIPHCKNSPNSTGPRT